jgi:7,8-dihydro-6-hydroxymethylpterin-pyrophosphokinase
MAGRATGRQLLPGAARARRDPPVIALAPHPQFRRRAFVLGPACAIARGWRDPVSGLTLAQLHARLTRRRPLPSGAPFA